MTNPRQLTLPITGMTCADCVATVERSIKKLGGVQCAVVNLFGFQMDLFNNPPGSEVYSLIPQQNLATRIDPADGVLLQSPSKVQSAR